MPYSAYPAVGQFGLTRIPGVTGLLVDAGQRIVGSGSHYTHAFIYIGNWEVVQAEPGGARRRPLADVLGGRPAVYSDFALSDAERESIVDHAIGMVGTPYSFLDYAAIGAARLLHTKALENYVGDTGHMICSQLVDEAFACAGIELFPDRIPGDVAPGDLARLIGA